jgi:hypothetical protein
MTSPLVTLRSDDTAGWALGVKELERLVDDLARHPAEWQASIRFGASERWWTRLRSDDLVDVWLLTWVRDTGTNLHDHGDSAGAFTVVSGELEEVRPDDTGSLLGTRLAAGSSRGIERGVVHDVRCPTPLPTISIHAYSPPLEHMTFYAAGAGGAYPVKTVSTRPQGALA